MELGKKVKELRKRKGLSQEELAEKASLSLRTIQRIESGETAPRGDTLKRLSKALDVSPDELLDWAEAEDRGYLALLYLSPLGMFLHPLLAIILPLILWIFKKDKVKGVNVAGKAILNFQITWLLAFLVFFMMSFGNLFLGFGISSDTEMDNIFNAFWKLALLYGYNVVFTIMSVVRSQLDKSILLVPAIPFLR
ncbi:MAG: DNA-binding protein [Cytophagales bacterium CG12_big_fil_rev_8_21_14_0_65_40_12]|nr:MAG: DNA-binding protein [Cytophagales bacterium CG12_big_fil_rev_8_21_14_0_65_40_12]PIW03992.1 MAG: DNA-binding protein [Cytophagales bacterium CG17_big_fil_post_rev_8_21_14_2_50_40_13]